MADQLWVVTSGVYAVPTAGLAAVEVATGAGISNSWAGFDVTFDGVTAAAVPAQINLMTFTGTGTGTAITFGAAHRANVSVQYNPVSTVKVNMTVIGAGGIIVASYKCHPQAGLSYQFPLGREFGMGPSMFKGIQVIAPAAVNCIVNLWFVE